MKKKNVSLIVSAVLWLIFAGFTILVMHYDVKPIGPNQSRVGFAAFNQFVFEKTGINFLWYELTEWLGIVVLLTAGGFGIVGVVQWIQRKSILKVDRAVLAMGIYDVIVVAMYISFEKYVVNYRPILLDGKLEASFPSSHVMVAFSILGAAIVYFQKRAKNNFVLWGFTFFAGSVIALMVAGRLISGVHWFTDIVGGVLLGAALVSLYRFLMQWMMRQLK
ncbi:phosphatase PAP2 family protein [Fusibacter paucivorans]|uniref:Phosphatase PAP2 family protein n=1 Tax=Fusibacter paucivorans TaxID=76009 RepID=A0ABS5PTS4_9FIRM|nr:phosphatase PAP2 family protein [Fusibacter paucivorans]MBS7527956.1 phosphatase PAP2 family protein [Fusibacter paucivorans]